MAEGPESAPAEVTERIVSLVPSATELLFALGAGESVVARTVHCNFPASVESLPSIGSGLDPDVERVIGLAPTLVVGAEMQAGLPALEVFRAAGLEVLLIPDGSLDDVDLAVTALGARLSMEAAATALVADFRSSLDAASVAPTEGSGASEAPRVLVVVGVEPLFAAGADTFIADLVERAGGQSALDGDWVALDDERVVTMAPSVIVQSGREASELEHWERFGDALPATRDGRVCLVDPDELARPGVRVVGALRTIRGCIEGGR